MLLRFRLSFSTDVDLLTHTPTAVNLCVGLTLLRGRVPCVLIALTSLCLRWMDDSVSVGRLLAGWA